MQVETFVCRGHENMENGPHSHCTRARLGDLSGKDERQIPVGSATLDEARSCRRMASMSLSERILKGELVTSLAARVFPLPS